MTGSPERPGLVARLLAVLAIAWASPATLIGLIIGLAGLLGGGRIKRHGRVLECWGPGIAWQMDHLPRIRGAAAVTFGHVVIGRTLADLDFCREHELVHVRQYERWGPFFLPAYLGCSLVLWLVGRNPYLDNPFEIEAFRESP